MPGNLGRPAGGCDVCAGFSLVENVLALVLFMIVVAASAPFLIQAFQAQAGLGNKAAAIAVAAQRLEYVRSVSPDKLLKGRYSGDVTALTNSPGLVDLTYDLTTSGNFDSSASSGSANAAVPLTSTQALSGVTYTVRTYVNPCYLSGSTGTCTALASNGSLAYRVSVDVAWVKPPGVVCVSGRTGQCEYVSSTLIDPGTDPTFNTYGTPSISQVNDATGSPVTALSSIHSGQVLTLQFVGTDFASGATTFSTLADKTAPVASNTGTVLTVQYQASSNLGNRTFSIINPNGTTGTRTLTVSKSSPTISGLSPSTAPRNVAKTYTLTGSDFFATPSLTTQTTKPTISMNGSAVVGGSTITVAPSISSISVVSKTSITFQATMPAAATPYTATGTLSLTNPDGGVATYSFTLVTT